MQASKKRKLEGKKEDVAALSLPILFFLVGFFFFFSPQFGLENVRVQFVCDAEHLHLNPKESGATLLCYFSDEDAGKLSEDYLREQSSERLILSNAVVCLEAEKTEYKIRGEM